VFYKEHQLSIINYQLSIINYQLIKIVNNIVYNIKTFITKRPKTFSNFNKDNFKQVEYVFE